MKNRNIDYQKMIYDFVVGKIDFDEFIANFQDNFNDVCEMLQNKINSLNDKQLQEFFDEYSKPVFAEVKFLNEEFEKSVQEKVNLLKQYGRPVPEFIYKNELVEQLAVESRNEISNGYKDVKSMILKIMENDSQDLIYGGKVTFLLQDSLFDTVAKLYDGLYEIVPNKNYEYKVQKSLIIDTVLDKIVGGNNRDIERVIDEKIFKPTKDITAGKNPDMETYQKRLSKVNSLIKTVFPANINYSKIDFDIHGKWPIEDGVGMTLEKDGGKKGYIFKSKKKN